jgi:hypothetical protein
MIGSCHMSVCNQVFQVSLMSKINLYGYVAQWLFCLILFYMTTKVGVQFPLLQNIYFAYES